MILPVYSSFGQSAAHIHRFGPFGFLFSQLVSPYGLAIQVAKSVMFGVDRAGHGTSVPDGGAVYRSTITFLRKTYEWVHVLPVTYFGHRCREQPTYWQVRASP